MNYIDPDEENKESKYYFPEDDDDNNYDELDDICPDCNGTGLSPYPDDGGSCPHCFGGKLPR